ncbi:putative S-adenosylmethionine-dependent methyltransferase/MSMEI_2290 [Caballeronia novacaledonica]|uniref:Putative S-adenosylmethionine-dependent methyltransferase/MSMEI_2290 n=1 Tax=Caballeronia novacaledonica TaxID=1544861 RepID=A0A2U3I6T8_9BURK|nr:methyltransferase domain-containing protein [Caballeronia novacaledonica]SPB15838.1 putative S-adenosylmethionine-dependent methyltransferase/MSMEI_2290 [Caballeronia novacaledonica]
MDTTADIDLFHSIYAQQSAIDEVNKLIDSSEAGLGIGGGGSHFDARRMAISVGYMKAFGLHKGYCVEIGSLDYLTAKVVWSFFPQAQVVGTGHDLRNTPMPFPDGSVDNVVCLEVIEHISDIRYRQATTLDGIFYFLEEVFRVLRVGGRALISTPNAASLWSMMQVLRGQPPMMYEWHFREFTMSELRQIVEHCGFQVVEHNSEYAWHLWDFSFLTRFMEEANFSCVHRGDDQFIVIEKPAVSERKPHSLNLPSSIRDYPRQLGLKTFARKLKWKLGVRPVPTR